MEIILLDDVNGLGKQFDTLKVKDGYGRNFLLPKKLAIINTKTNKAVIDSEISRIKSQEAKTLKNINVIVDQLQKFPIKVTAKAGAGDRIFGSITNQQLSDAIKKQTGVVIDRRKIEIVEEVKTLGTYKAQINLREDINPEISFEVMGE